MRFHIGRRAARRTLQHAEPHAYRTVRHQGIRIIAHHRLEAQELRRLRVDGSEAEREKKE